MNASRGCSIKCMESSGVSETCSRGSRSSGSVPVAIWNNGNASSVLKRHKKWFLGACI